MGLKTTIRKIKKAIRFYSLENKRKKLIAELANKDKIKVAFLGYALGGSSDVFSGLYKLFAADSRFEPYVVIVPNSHGTKDAMIEIQNQAKEYLDKLGIPYICGYDVDSDSFVDIAKTINPDVVFMCHHYEWFPREFKIDNFMDKITYVFLYGCSLLENLKSHVNSKMHTFAHTVFYPTKMMIDYARSVSQHPTRNICPVFLGSPKMDTLLPRHQYKNVWKTGNTHKKVIWAPHHYDAPFSNFLECADLFLALAEKYKDKIEFCFRPHPGLKFSLVNKNIWSQEQVDNYYKRWQELENGHVSSGEFVDLFYTSDAMILDSIAFIAEYSFTNKPALFVNKPDQTMSFNTFGQAIKENIYNCYDVNDIEKFIKDVVLSGNDTKARVRGQFVLDNMIPPNNKTASENVYFYVLNEIFKQDIKELHNV